MTTNGWSKRMVDEPDERVASQWVEWARELVTMAQTGLTYSKDAFDIARYVRVRDIAVAMFAAGSKTEFATIAGIFDAETGHATPKVDVRAFVLLNGALLLVRERAEGRWSLPGGWADVGETPREAVEREVAEESGYEVRATRLLAVYDKRLHNHPPQPFYIYKLFFACELIGGTPVQTDETDGAGFFEPHALPELSLDRIVPSQIERLYAIAADPLLPADFD
jgi:ADP-ribose pyrophosphatase YjhB (NUDIX family)